MAKKKRNSGEEDIEAYRHEKETRKNLVPVELASYDTPKHKPKKFEYDLHLDNINKAVKRNIDCFPQDFMFQLTKQQADS
jgi:hypothetical protein